MTSLSSMTKSKVPAVVGVPAIAVWKKPVWTGTVRPGGNDPETIDNANGGNVPNRFRVWLYGTPTVPEAKALACSDGSAPRVPLQTEVPDAAWSAPDVRASAGAVPTAVSPTASINAHAKVIPRDDGSGLGRAQRISDARNRRRVLSISAP